MQQPPDFVHRKHPEYVCHLTRPCMALSSHPAPGFIAFDISFFALVLWLPILMLLSSSIAIPTSLLICWFMSMTCYSLVQTLCFFSMLLSSLTLLFRSRILVLCIIFLVLSFCLSQMVFSSLNRSTSVIY